VKAGLGYSAIGNFISLHHRIESIKLTSVRQALANADSIIDDDDDSEMSLYLAAGWEVEAVGYVIETIEFLINAYPTIVKHDQTNWLEFKK
jgi:hypothetical protein